MARKSKRTSNKRISKKALDAFNIAERAENGSNSDGDNDSYGDELEVNDGIVDARRFLGDDAGRNDDLEDEELDSDEALGSDDDFDVLNSQFSQTIRDKNKRKKLQAKSKRYGSDDDVESDGLGDEEYDSVDENQLVSLSEAFDMNGELSGKHKNNEIVLDEELDSDSGADESTSESEDEDDDDEDDEEEDEEEKILQNDDNSDNDEDIELTNTLTYLTSKNKNPKEKRKLITETTEENEFSLPTHGAKLSLNEMLAAVGPSGSKDAILIEKAEDSGKSKALAAPLPKRIQERNDRSVAYDLAKEEVSKWDETVQQNRRAEVLKFPMKQEPSPNTSATTFRSSNTPTTALEKKVHNLLTESSLADDKKEATFEEIAVAKLLPEELKKRTNELRLMRELMFRDEMRARRIKKIKSKSYHRIKKKERMRNEQLVEGSDYGSDEEEHDIKRAEERMSLKHKTQSQWAKNMIKSGLSKDSANRSELEEMLRRGEQLRAKQLGYEEGEQSDEAVSDIEREYDNDPLSQEDDKLRSSLGKGVLGMDFMKAAEKRQKQENLQGLKELRKLEGLDGSSDGEDASNLINVSKNDGRRVYTPNLVSQKANYKKVNEKLSNEIRDDEERNLDNQLSKASTKSSTKSSNKSSDKQEKDPKLNKSQKSNEADIKDPDDGENPWLKEDFTKPLQKSNKVSVVDHNSSKLAKAARKISKSKKRSAGQDGTSNLIIDIQDTLTTHNPGPSGTTDMSDDDGQEVQMFNQRDLIKQAFAGDDVVREFEEEKRQVVEDEGDKEEDMTLPGWGDWTGGGKRSKKRRVVRKIDGVVQKDKRKDKNLKDVIINEKVNKKNLKYQSSAVPFPYESREQYERSLRMPVGQEWTSRETHQKLIMPRVIVKQGAPVDPLKAPFK